jgi:hypothetical protein
MKMLQYLLKFLETQNGSFANWAPCRMKNNLDKKNWPSYANCIIYKLSNDTKHAQFQFRMKKLKGFV